MTDARYVNPQYLHSELTARIIAAAREVHRSLGPGFEEVIYQRALARELPTHGVEFSREVWIDVHYKGEKIGTKRVDFVAGLPAADASVMVELKARSALEDVHFVQTLSYLKASGYTIGLLINFGGARLVVRRLAN